MAKAKPEPKKVEHVRSTEQPISGKMDFDTMQKEAIKLVKVYDEEVDERRCVTERVDDIGSGYLFIVYDESRNDEEYYVHFAPGRQPRVFGWVRDYAPWLAEIIRRRNWWQSASDFGAVLLGGAITITICAMSIFNKDGSPDILNNAFTTIIGFYFGSQIMKGQQSH